MPYRCWLVRIHQWWESSLLPRCSAFSASTEASTTSYITKSMHLSNVNSQCWLVQASWYLIIGTRCTKRSTSACSTRHVRAYSLTVCIRYQEAAWTCKLNSVNCRLSQNSLVPFPLNWKWATTFIMAVIMAALSMTTILWQISLACKNASPAHLELFWTHINAEVHCFVISCLVFLPSQANLPFLLMLPVLLCAWRTLSPHFIMDVLHSQGFQLDLGSNLMLGSGRLCSSWK